ncbi:hypothetical protein NC652_035509 [Populus alba x Populus x berolinensis]|uniref:Uncharacterized protein n=1 Tax=Populus alba x Populus x berolinensis TaxID=444605 RepID=A0AAD6LQ40_9ROSI|nr:hypothetical protein NC652_035509 [Populus alba x Populus x berolinensis]KAJ6971141.1 hypothetical protein NC653_035422 [Populus alba x Populus x berolinensis]
MASGRSLKFTAFHKILAAVLLYFFRFKLGDEKKKVKYRTMFTLHLEDKGLHFYAFHRL